MRYMNTVKKRASQMHLMHLSSCLRYLRDIYAIRTPPVSVIHIGYVRLSIEEDEDRYIVRHYTLDRKELPNEWNMSNFYNGEYGLKSANNLRS